MNSSNQFGGRVPGHLSIYFFTKVITLPLKVYNKVSLVSTFFTICVTQIVDLPDFFLFIYLETYRLNCTRTSNVKLEC